MFSLYIIIFCYVRLYTVRTVFVFEFIRARLDQWLLFKVDDVVTSINIAILIILVVDGCHG